MNKIIGLLAAAITLTGIAALTAPPAHAAGITSIVKVDGRVWYDSDFGELYAKDENNDHCIRARLFVYDNTAHDYLLAAKVTDCDPANGAVGEQVGFRYADAQLQICRATSTTSAPYNCSNMVPVA